MAVELGPVVVPMISYGFIVSGAFMFIYVFVRAAYKNMEIIGDPQELLEMGRRTLRSASLVSHHIIHIHRDSYVLLRDDNNNTGTNNNADADDDDEEVNNNCAEDVDCNRDGYANEEYEALNGKA